MGFHQSLLGDVGGVVRRTTDGRGQPQSRRLISANERAESSVVPVAGAKDEIRVGRLGSFGGHGR
jgi:hypothetical protein